MDSTILSSTDFENLFSITGTRQFKLIYRASRDSFTASAFHSRCDYKSRTLTVIRSQSGNIFGGYTTATWEGSGYKNDGYSYLFSLKRNGASTKDKISVRRPGNDYQYWKRAIYADPNFGPIFGNEDLKVISRSNIYLGSRTATYCANYIYANSSYFPQCSNAQAVSFLAGSQYNWLSNEIEVFQFDDMHDMNTVILNQAEISYLYERTSARKFILLYRASIHGFRVEAFHSRCDYKPNTITIIRSNYNSVFVGRTRQTWEGYDYKYDEAYIHSLRRKGVTSPVQLDYTNPSFAIFAHKNYGPTFGQDITIRNNSNIEVGSFSNLGHSYRLPSGLTYGSTAAREYLAGSYNTWTTTEIEVFQIVSR